MLFKNGNHRIKLKNGNKRSVAQKNIETKTGMMTNDQLLMEHVFDLEARLKVMEMKHKKLKKKYKGLKQDIYVDVDEGETQRAEGEAENQVSTNQPEREEVKKEEVRNEVKKAENIFEQRMNEAQNEISSNYSNVPAYMRRQQQLRGWRSRISLK